MTSRDVEEMRQAVEFSDSEVQEAVEERIRRVRGWDDLHPRGEGTAVERVRAVVDGRYQWVEVTSTYQWVRVTSAKGKVEGTFFIRHHDGEVLELFVATVRKGLPPNPYERSGVSQISWTKVDADEALEWEEELARRAALSSEERERHMNAELERLEAVADFERRNNPDEPLDTKQYQQDAERIRRDWSGELHQDTRPLEGDYWADLSRAGNSGADIALGQRPTLRILPENALGGDVRFKFRTGEQSFRVRGSKLGRVLLGFRKAGHQKVSMEMIRAAIEYVDKDGRIGT